jgi:uncharacterized membrane protein YeaQ/YmgE (transglycosylase-associated protein family)
MLEIVWIVIIGAVVGALAKLLMPGPDPGGFFVTALLGMGGALVGTFLGRFVGLYGPNQGAGFIASVVGAIIVLFVYPRCEGAGPSEVGARRKEKTMGHSGAIVQR